MNERKLKALTFSYDDGALQDAKLVKIFNKKCKKREIFSFFLFLIKIMLFICNHLVGRLEVEVYRFCLKVGNVV